MVSDETRASDEQLVLRDIRALLDQLQLDRDGSLTMQSRLTDDLGVDSLALVELCDQFERTFGVTLPDEVFLTAATPDEWLAAITAARGSVTGTYVPRAEMPKSQSTVTNKVRAVSTRLLRTARAQWRKRSNRNPSSASSSASQHESSAILYEIYAWTLLVPFAVAIWTLAILPMSLAQRRNTGRVVARATCRALGITVHVEGVLPDSAHPAVIAANHSSFIDGLVLYVFLNEPVTFVSSTDMEHQFLLGRIMRGFGCVFVDRGRAERSAASVEKLVDTIHSGHHVLIFPEGSISERPGLRVFHLGAFEAATSSNCTVIPVGIRGSREVLRPGSFRPHRGAVHVAIGESITSGANDFSDRVVLRDAVRAAIARLSEQEDSPATS
jgi:acyl carrier protein